MDDDCNDYYIYDERFRLPSKLIVRLLGKDVVGLHTWKAVDTLNKLLIKNNRIKRKI